MGFTCTLLFPSGMQAFVSPILKNTPVVACSGINHVKIDGPAKDFFKAEGALIFSAQQIDPVGYYTILVSGN